MMAFFSLYRFWIYGALIVALIAGAWRVEAHIEGIGYDKAKAECIASADEANKQAQARRDEQAANAAIAAAGYESSRIAWEKTLKVAKHDLFVATENLAGCKLDGAAIVLLNAAGSDDAKSP
jgi:hypothetical protein